MRYQKPSIAQLGSRRQQFRATRSKAACIPMRTRTSHGPAPELPMIWTSRPNYQWGCAVEARPR